MYTLLENTLSTLDPVFCTIEETIAKADEIASEELGHTLQTAFMVIHKATGGLSAQLKRTARTATGGFLKRGSILPEDGADLQERTLADAEVAQLLSVLLSKVAGTVKLAEGLVSQLPVLGPVLNPLFIQINGDLALILSSVGNLLVGVVGLVRDLVSTLTGHQKASRDLWLISHSVLFFAMKIKLSGVLTTVVALPILDSLLGGLLGGL